MTEGRSVPAQRLSGAGGGPGLSGPVREQVRLDILRARSGSLGEEEFMYTADLCIHEHVSV
jgi:hypothetical protein